VPPRARPRSRSDPELLIFDSKRTTQAVLTELDDREAGFSTLRAGPAIPLPPRPWLLSQPAPGSR